MENTEQTSGMKSLVQKYSAWKINDESKMVGTPLLGSATLMGNQLVTECSTAQLGNGGEIKVIM